MTARMVYFLRPVGMDGPVKIGCSEWPETRLTSFMSWSPFRLEIAATIAGGLDLEARFHTHFAESHSHGEWFHFSREMGAVIDALRAGTFDVASLPSSAPFRGKHRKRSPAERQMGHFLNQLVIQKNTRGIVAPAALRAKIYALPLMAEPDRDSTVRQIAEHLANPTALGLYVSPRWAAIDSAKAP